MITNDNTTILANGVIPRPCWVLETSPSNYKKGWQCNYNFSGVASAHGHMARYRLALGDKSALSHNKTNKKLGLAKNLSFLFQYL